MLQEFWKKTHFKASLKSMWITVYNPLYLRNLINFWVNKIVTKKQFSIGVIQWLNWLNKKNVEKAQIQPDRIIVY